MKRALLLLTLVLGAPLIGCGGTPPPAENTDATKSALKFPFWNTLSPCPDGWLWSSCVTPDNQTVTDISYLRTDLECGWTQPYNFGCSIEGTSESVGTELACRHCQTATGELWTTIRYHWYRQEPDQIAPPTDAQIYANPNGYNAYGAYADGSGYWDFIREEYTFTGKDVPNPFVSSTSGTLVYTWRDDMRRMSDGMITDFEVDLQDTGTWSTSGSVVTITLYNSNGTYNGTGTYSFLIDKSTNQQLNLSNYPADGTPTRYFYKAD